MPIPAPLPSNEALDEFKQSICVSGPGCKKHNRANNAFINLVDEIKAILGPSSGIDSSDVDVEDLKDAMRRYNTNENHWSEFALPDFSRNYTRNFVDHGNGKANLLVLVWSPGKGSLIHDHAGAHCIMKVLKGSLRETLYEMPTSPNKPLNIQNQSTYNVNEVAYISDDIGLHKIENVSEDEPAVSLHLYTPPWAEKNGCYCFSAETGERSKVQMCNYYSVHGKVKKTTPL